MRQKKSIGKLKDDSVFPLNDVESTLHDKPIKNIRRKMNMNKHSANVRYGALWLKKLLGETLLFLKGED